MFYSHKDEQNALKSLEKRSNFVLEKSVKPQSDYCTNPERGSVNSAWRVLCHM